MNITWTEKELNYLVKNWHKISNAEIAKKLNKTESAVRTKATKYITIDMMMGRHWSKIEDKLLQTLYGTMSMSDLSKRMKRTVLSIERRIRIIEGSSDYMVLQPVYNTEDVSGFLGITSSVLTRRIPKSDMPFYRVNSKFVIKQNDFWNWLKDNLDKANYKSIKEEYELSSPEWYYDIVKAKKRELQNDNSFKKWTKSEEALVWAEMLKGTRYDDIAKLVGRGKNSIAKKIVQLSKKRMTSVAN